MRWEALAVWLCLCNLTKALPTNTLPVAGPHQHPKHNHHQQQPPRYTSTTRSSASPHEQELRQMITRRFQNRRTFTPALLPPAVLELFGLARDEDDARVMDRGPMLRRPHDTEGSDLFRRIGMDDGIGGGDGGGDGGAGNMRPLWGGGEGDGDAGSWASAEDWMHTVQGGGGTTEQCRVFTQFLRVAEEEPQPGDLFHAEFSVSYRAMKLQAFARQYPQFTQWNWQQCVMMSGIPGTSPLDTHEYPGQRLAVAVLRLLPSQPPAGIEWQLYVQHVVPQLLETLAVMEDMGRFPVHTQPAVLALLPSRWPTILQAMPHIYQQPDLLRFLARLPRPATSSSSQ